MPAWRAQPGICCGCTSSSAIACTRAAPPNYWGKRCGRSWPARHTSGSCPRAWLRPCGQLATPSGSRAGLLRGFQLADDLLRGVPGAFHGEVPGPVWPAEGSHSPWTDCRGPRHRDYEAGKDGRSQLLESHPQGQSPLRAHIAAWVHLRHDSPLAQRHCPGAKKLAEMTDAQLAAFADKHLGDEVLAAAMAPIE
jgi:hypothetical protein